MMTVYVLEDKYGSMYIGLTNNIDRRLGDHKAGNVGTTSKLHVPSLVLRHFWLVPLYSTASRFERYLHSVSKADVLELVLDCPVWSNLLEELALTKPLQYSEAEMDKTGKHKFYPYALVSLPNEDQLAKVRN